MKPAAFVYSRAASAGEAASVLAATPGARILAGGQSLGPMMNLRLARPARLVDIADAADLRCLHETADRLTIGAGFTHAEIEDGVVPDPCAGLLAHVARHIAHRAVRNRGTLGGSLAHADPAADWLSVAVALDAAVLARRPDGSTVRYAAADFTTGAFTTRLAPDEVLVAVDLPRLSAGARWGWEKICRKVGAFADAIGLAVRDVDRARVVVGAVDGPPCLLPRTAAALADPRAAEALVPDELAERLPYIDPARRALHVTAVRRAVRRLA